MNLKLWHKVFLAFLLNSLLIIVCILLIGRYYSERHFRGYLNKVEAIKVTKLVNELSREYSMRGSWDSVLKDPGLWFGLRWLGPDMPPGPEMAAQPLLPPVLEAMEKDRKPPPPAFPLPHSHDDQGIAAIGEFYERPPDDFSAPPPEGFAGPPPGPPVALFDAGKRPLTPVGDVPSPDSYRLTPIKVDGRLAGWVGVRRFEPMTHHLDVEFIKRQARTFYVIGAVVLILGGLVTFLLSRHLLAPVRELEKGTKALGSRRFDTRIAVKSQDELGKLAAGFNAMAQALEKHQQAQQRWLVDVSHELRTPLAILRGEIEAMQDGVREVTPKGLDSLHLEVLHLSRIVGDLHDLSLIESRGLSAELAAVNVSQIISDTLDSFRSRLEQRGIRLDITGSAERAVLVMADSDRLRQLFSNLLENTLRYADIPGVLKISIEAVDGEVYVSFEDSGPGVPEESLVLLFDRLYRVDRSRSRKHGGSGLGLAICKSIVESFGGRIEASNSTAGGLKVGMVFPCLLGTGDFSIRG